MKRTTLTALAQMFFLIIVPCVSGCSRPSLDAKQTFDVTLGATPGGNLSSVLDWQGIVFGVYREPCNVIVHFPSGRSYRSWSGRLELDKNEEEKVYAISLRPIHEAPVPDKLKPEVISKLSDLYGQFSEPSNQEFLDQISSLPLANPVNEKTSTQLEPRVGLVLVFQRHDSKWDVSFIFRFEAKSSDGSEEDAKEENKAKGTEEGNPDTSRKGKGEDRSR